MRRKELRPTGLRRQCLRRFQRRLCRFPYWLEPLQRPHLLLLPHLLRLPLRQHHGRFASLPELLSRQLDRNCLDHRRSDLFPARPWNHLHFGMKKGHDREIHNHGHLVTFFFLGAFVRYLRAFQAQRIGWASACNEWFPHWSCGVFRCHRRNTGLLHCRVSSG